MPKTIPKAGDELVHHGRRHAITAIDGRPTKDADDVVGTVDVFSFESTDQFAGEPIEVPLRAGGTRTKRIPRFQGVGLAKELRWSEADGAWFLPGRVLSRDERTLYAAAFGTWPPAEIHLTARRALDQLEFAEVDGVRLVEWIVRMRLKHIAEAYGLTPLDGETKSEFAARCKAAAVDYAPKCLAHCAELRELRKGD